MKSDNQENKLTFLPASRFILFDISLIGSLGLIILAKRKGLLNLAKPEIERLIAVGLHIDSAMLSRIFIRIGEDDNAV